VLLITRKNIKVRARLARITAASATLYKQGYDQAITAVVDEHGPTEMVLRCAPAQSGSPKHSPCSQPREPMRRMSHRSPLGARMRPAA